MAGTIQTTSDDAATRHDQQLDGEDHEEMEGFNVEEGQQGPRHSAARHRRSVAIMLLFGLLTIALLTFVILAAVFMVKATHHNNTSGNGQGNEANGDPMTLTSFMQLVNVSTRAHERFCSRCFPDFCHTFEITLGVLQSTNKKSCQLMSQSDYVPDIDDDTLTWSGVIPMPSVLTACSTVEAFRDVVTIMYPANSVVTNSTWLATCDWY